MAAQKFSNNFTRANLRVRPSIGRRLIILALLTTLALLLLNGSQCASTGRETPPRAEVIYDKAQNDLRRQRFEEAKFEYRKLFTEYPESELADNALFKLGYIACVQKDYLDASDLFSTLIAKYPKSEWNFDAKVWLGLLDSWRKLDDELDKVEKQLGIAQEQPQQEDTPAGTSAEIEELQEQINRLRDENRKLRELIESIE